MERKGFGMSLRVSRWIQVRGHVAFTYHHGQGRVCV